MGDEHTKWGEPSVSDENRPWTRRRVLAGTGLAGLALLAGCSGGGDGGDGGDGDDGGDGGDGGGGGAEDGGGGGGGGDGDSGDGGSGSAGIGRVLSGQYVDFAVEYARPVDEVRDYDFYPYDDAATYGAPLTVDDLVSTGDAEAGDALYAVGIAVRNTSDTLVEFGSFLLNPRDTSIGGLEWPWGGRSQRLAFEDGVRFPMRHLVPGEAARGELVFALPAEVGQYEVRFDPYDDLTGEFESFVVDLGAGAEGTADFSQDIDAVASTGQPTIQADFEVTLDGVALVDSVEGGASPYGQREGFRYLRLDLTATRRREDRPDDWIVFGVVDADGYGFMWDVLLDAYDQSQFSDPLLSMAVGETRDDVVLALPIEEGFDPVYVTMTSTGAYDPDSPTGEAETIRTTWAMG